MSMFFTESPDGNKLFLGALKYGGELYDITKYVDKHPFMKGKWLFKPGCEDISLTDLIDESIKMKKIHKIHSICKLKNKPKRKSYHQYQTGIWYTATYENSQSFITAC